MPSGGNQIVSVKPNGKGERELTAGSKGSSSDPSYSPSGAQIVFVSSRDGASDDIYVMDADGRNVTRVTDTADRDEETPGFSADGDSIVFAADGQIRSIGVDGSGERTNRSRRAAGRLL